MKRILVIDESEVVRETLALILGREFAVSQRSLGSKGLPIANAHEECDLLILGVSPQYGLEATSIVRVAAHLPFAVLLLVDSKAAARAIEEKATVGCLTKPFNPYELHEKVGQLLARRLTYPTTDVGAPARKHRDVFRYLDFPFLSRSAATIVRRFAAARLPLLIYGEIGCGQDRIAAAVHGLQTVPGRCVSLNAAEVNDDYLAQKCLDLSTCQTPNAAPATLVIENLDKSGASAQSLLIRFLDDAAEKFAHVRCLATATVDLLERVYRGEFLDALYYRVATLTLKLAPLRERSEDIPIAADWFARSYAEGLGIADPIFSPEAKRRLSNYLWFGNLSELETVIARTLALHGKSRIEPGDLVFDFSANSEVSELSEFVPIQAQRDVEPAEPRFQVYGAALSANGHAKSVELNTVIHELAHELKNPMVTIKTFAQLLGDRYEDESFRSRFQEVVGDDIERMDDLLEVMIEFADFGEPRRSNVVLQEKLREALKDIESESAKRQTQFQWKANGVSDEVKIDEAQLFYVFKNVMLATLLEARMGSQIEIDITQRGAVSIAYLREGPRTASITHYLDGVSARPGETILPLRILLAKQLVERNGGRFVLDQSEDEREILRIEFPTAEH